MEFLGGISGMNFSPISNYNNYLNKNASFEIDSSNMDFEHVLNQQTAGMQNSIKIQGGVEKNNFDDLMAQASVKSAEDSASTGNFINSFSKSLNGGLTAVNNNIKAADKAQEALAMGEDVSVHDVMIATEKASLSLQMAMQLRNKMMAAYTEINNIKV